MSSAAQVIGALRVKSFIDAKAIFIDAKTTLMAV